MSNRARFAFFVAVCMAFCRPAPAQSELDRERQAILAVIDTQSAAWNRGDIEGYMQGYWKSDSLLFTSGGTIQRGWNATFQKYKKSYDTREKMGELEFSGLEITLLSESSAWVLGRWKLHRRADAPGGVFTLIFKKFPEGWRIVHDHTSSDPPPDGKQK